MIAVDTNVVVRCLIDDDPAQARRARTLVANHPVWVSLTVLLETGWVLRSLYRITPQRIASALRGFAGLRTVTVEDEQTLARALDWSERGVDFADALHLSAARERKSFATFDEALLKAAARIGIEGVAAP